VAVLISFVIFLSLVFKSTLCNFWARIKIVVVVVVVVVAVVPHMFDPGSI